MKVLILAKTHVLDMACVGGMVYDTAQGLRLLQTDGSHQPVDTDFEVGQVWDVRYEPGENLRPPHVEDVWVFESRYLGKQIGLPGFLTARVEVWQGGCAALFGGCVRLTNKGSGYIAEQHGIPDRSAGFWLPEQPLQRVMDGHRCYYACGDEIRLRYVGFVPSMETIPARTLLRVSLARWWRPDHRIEARCYLQLSGWYE